MFEVVSKIPPFWAGIYLLAVVFFLIFSLRQCLREVECSEMESSMKK